MKKGSVIKKIALATTLVTVSGVIITTMIVREDHAIVTELSKDNSLVEIKRTETKDPETNQITITEEPILNNPPQKPQPQRVEVVKVEEEAVDIKTYTRRVLEYRWSSEVIDDTQWQCFDTFMSEAHKWSVTETEVDKIIDDTMKYSNPCALMFFYRSNGKQY